jgi:hypothetical protein
MDVTTAVVAPCESRSGLGRWAAANPTAFAGLWFAGAASLLSAHALLLLPGLVAEARTLGGLAAWQVGAVTLGHVYLSPALLALVTGCLLGGPIIAPGCGEGWAAAVRGAVIAAIIALTWALMAAGLLGFTSALAPAGSSDTPAGALEVFALTVVALLLAVAIPCGAAAGYLLHALFAGPSPGGGREAESGTEAGSTKEAGDEDAEGW